MRLVNRSLIAGIVLSLIPTTAVHATANLRMSLDQFGYYSCDLADPGPGGVVLAYVFLTSHPGAHSVRFAAPVPPASGYSYIGNSPSIGDPENGFVLPLGDCETGPELIMTMLLVRTSAGSPCSMWRIAPYPGDSQVVYTDCQGLQQVATHGTGIALNSNGNCEHGTPPYNPIPPAGAIGVPMQTQLAWSFDIPDCPEISGRDDRIYFGTTPNPPLVDDFVDSPYTVGPLLPNTTYYWKVFVRAYGNAGTSPVWSFTTAGPVSVMPSTWGAIKALYR